MNTSLSAQTVTDLHALALSSITTKTFKRRLFESRRHFAARVARG